MCVGGPVGMVVGAVAGGLVGGAVLGYSAAVLDERNESNGSTCFYAA